MMMKLDVLAKEYHSNIQKRRVYDLARNSHKSMSRFDPNNAESPLKQMVGRANQFLKEFSQRTKAKSHVRLNTIPLLSPIKHQMSHAMKAPEKTSPQQTIRKIPFELKDGKHSKSFRVIEFKDRRKIDVLASTAKQVFSSPSPNTVRKSLIVESPEKAEDDTARNISGTDGGTSE